MAYTYKQLKQIWLQAAKGTSYETQSWANLMAAIALAESGGNASAQNDADNNGTQTSWGLWQISNGTHTAPSSSWSNALVNAQLAVQKLNSQGLTAWGTYTSGAYKKYLNGATPVTGNGGTGGGTSAGTGTLTSFNPVDPSTWGPSIAEGFFSGLAQSLGLSSVSDVFERFGLVLLGAVLIIVGIVKLASPAAKYAVNTVNKVKT